VSSKQPIHTSACTTDKGKRAEMFCVLKTVVPARCAHDLDDEPGESDLGAHLSAAAQDAQRVAQVAAAGRGLERSVQNGIAPEIDSGLS
jgi:hypothetical protein